jgi:crotonobetainyl-CoA:carnitine CoA-transferase CaiB-like acyl-CoA transferase
MLPLNRVRIVSLALNLPGPAALMRCRALGATCVKVEPSTHSGDPMRAYSPVAYARMHAGIRTLICDLKTQAGQVKLAKELAKADILLTSFRPSALKRLGLDWPQLRTRYPKLSQVAIVGGEGAAAEVAGHDLTYLAQSGLVSGLELPTTLFADMAGSLLTVEAILGMALQAKMAGKPSCIRVSLSNAAEYLALPRTWGLTQPDGAVGGAHAGYQVYKCKDGRAAVAALETHFAARLCTAAGLKELNVAVMRRWFRGQTRESLDKLALAQDLPIHTMA